jgi:hypothetical protein
MTPTVAPERFYDPEVIVKVQTCMYARAWVSGRGLPELHRSTPCGLGAFNAVVGCLSLILSGHPDDTELSPTVVVCCALEFMTWAEQSDLVNPVMAPFFWKILVFPTSRGRLVWVGTSLGSPHGEGGLDCSVLPWSL